MTWEPDRAEPVMQMGVILLTFYGAMLAFGAVHTIRRRRWMRQKRRELRAERKATKETYSNSLTTV